MHCPDEEIKKRFERWLEKQSLDDSSKNEIRDIVYFYYNLGVTNTAILLEENTQFSLQYWWKRFQNLRKITRPFWNKKEKEDIEEFLNRIIKEYLQNVKKENTTKG